MKRIFIFFFSCFLASSIFSQEEVWGYQSFGGEIGGGLVFKLDLENQQSETIHSFGYSFGYSGYSSDNALVDGGNGLLYGTANIKINHHSSYNIKHRLISYHPSSNEINLLQEIPNEVEIAFTDKENHLIYFWLDDSQDSKIYQYDIANDTMHKLLDVDFDYGKELAGEWKEIDGKYYFFTVYRGENLRGSFLEYNPILNQIVKVFDFDELKNPQGSIIEHENQFFYGIAQRGGENNQGSIFKLDPKGGGLEKLIEFTDEIGTAPTGESILAQDNCIYGITRTLGDYGKGSVYKYNPEDNILEALYHFNPTSEFMTGHLRSYQLNYDGENKIYFMMEGYETMEQYKGYLMCFNIETLEMEIVFDFHESIFNRPINKLTYFNDTYYGLATDDTINGRGGIFKFDPDNNELELLQDINYTNNAEDGQNPFWICQGAYGSVYGMTSYGGAENKGVIFSIDENTSELNKLMDLNDLGIDVSIRNEAFLLENGNILGFLIETQDGNYSNLKAFEFNPLSLQLEEKFEFPNNVKPSYDIKMNSEGNLYFASGYDDYSVYEYLIDENELHELEISNDSSIRNIYEANPGIYYGMTASNILKWDRNNNTLDSVFNVHYFGDEGVGSFRHDIYIDKNDRLFGTFLQSEYKPSWLNSFTYYISGDSASEQSDLGNAFYDNSFKAFLEPELGDNLILAIFNRTDEITVKNLNTFDEFQISLEKCPFYIDYYYDTWNGWDIDGGNQPFQVSPSIGLISVQPKGNIAFWTGIEDTIWANQNNWYRAKLPSNVDEIIISGSAIHFPHLDTLIDITDLYIEKQAQIKIGSRGALSCLKLNNEGRITMLADSKNRASLIFEEVEEKGTLEYKYQSIKKEEKLLAMPVSEMKYSSFDSLNIWEYRNLNWMQMEDTTLILNCHHIYKYGVDTIETILFRGEVNTENMEFPFHEKGPQALPNPYAASLLWDELDLSNLSCQAHYRFIEKDSVFISYVDGLGTSPPLVQPLEVVWVMAEPDEYIELKIEDRIHAHQFEIENNTVNNKLSLSLEGNGRKDFTHIRFNPNTTAEFDQKSDAYKLIISDSSPSIFTLAGNEILSINQLPDTTMLDMAVSTGKNGMYTIGIHEKIDFDFVVLEDLILNTKTDLLIEDYKFEYFTSDGHYPFRLYFKDWVLEPLEESDVDIYYYPDRIFVRSKKQIKTAEITFFDLAGRIAEQYAAQNFFIFEKAVDLPSGHYIVQFRSDDLVINKKILIRR